jgi:hypothetical protein
MAANYLFLFPSSTRVASVNHQAGFSMSSTPLTIPQQAISARDIIQPRDYIDAQIPNSIDYTDFNIFNQFLRETATTEEEFKGQMVAYPILQNVNVLDAISLSRFPLQQLTLPSAISRFQKIYLPRELRFWILTRGGLPAELYNVEALYIITKYPNLYPAYKLYPQRVKNFISVSDPDTISSIPEEASMDILDPDNKELLPKQIFIPYDSDLFPSWLNWVATNNSILETQQLTVDEQLEGKLESATFAIRKD